MRLILLFITLLFLFPPSCFAQKKLIIQKAVKMITLTGYTRSKTTVTVSSEVSGKVLRVNYDVGQVIDKKPFFEIDPTFINFQIESTHQSVKKLKITQQKMNSRVAYLKKEFKRIDKLHKGDRVTEVKRDAAKEELNQAKFEARSLNVEKAVLETALKELKEHKRRHSIYAPKGWIVVKKNIEQGEIVSPDTPLATVADYQNLVVPLSVVSEELAALKRLSDEFDVRVEGRPAKASINWINPEFNEKTRKLSIEAGLVNYDGEKRGGLRFSLPIEIETEGFLVPKTAVINHYDNPRVNLKETGETINIMVLGESGDTLIIAEDGRLSPGMELSSK